MIFRGSLVVGQREAGSDIGGSDSAPDGGARHKSAGRRRDGSGQGNKNQCLLHARQHRDGL